MAATASAAVKKIRSWHGDSESNGRAQSHIMSKYNKMMGCHKSVKTTAWCAITIVVMLWLIGIRNLCKSAGCKQQMRWYKRRKRWKARINRSIQAEGVFGVTKQDYGFKRFLMRGKENVATEYTLLAIAFDLNKLHNRIQSKRVGQALFPLSESA